MAHEPAESSVELSREEEKIDPDNLTKMDAVSKWDWRESMCRKGHQRPAQKS